MAPRLPPSPLTSEPPTCRHLLKLYLLCNLNSLVVVDNGSNKNQFQQVLCWKQSLKVPKHQPETLTFTLAMGAVKNKLKLFDIGCSSVNNNLKKNLLFKK